MDKQMKLLLKIIDGIIQKHEKKQQILTLWQADVKLTLDVFKMLSVFSAEKVWKWKQKHIYILLSSFCSSSCAAVIVVSSNSTL